MRWAPEALKRDHDEYEFELAVVNTGELTIRDFLLCVRVVCHDERLNTFGDQFGGVTEYRFDKCTDEVIAVAATSNNVENVVLHHPPRKLFPGNRIVLPEQSWRLRVAAGSVLAAASLILEWTIYLDDAAPVKDTIDLGFAFQGAAPPGPGN